MCSTRNQLLGDIYHTHSCRAAAKAHNVHAMAALAYHRVAGTAPGHTHDIRLWGQVQPTEKLPPSSIDEAQASALTQQE